MSKNDILEVLKNNHLCVLSSISADGAPQSALVGFAEDENMRLIVGTSNKSRKYRNILNNPAVSLVIGGFEEDKEDRRTLQIEGTAHEVSDEERITVQAIQVAKHPANARFQDLPDETYIVIKPTWIRLTDASEIPWKVEELEVSA